MSYHSSFPDNNISSGEIINHPILTLVSTTGSVKSQVTDPEIDATLQRISACPHFAKAHRCLGLLVYLTRHASAGLRPPSEYDIGLAVFRRDPDSYFTADDPIVRVQMGRLRQRLEAYYASEGNSDPLRIVLPLGSYQAYLERRSTGLPPPASRPNSLTFLPVDCLTPDALAQAFTLGLNEELTYRLHRDFLPQLCASQREQTRHIGQGAHQVLLEGTLRMDRSRVRLSLRMRYRADGEVFWHELFDGVADGSISAQEQLAERCVLALPSQLPLPPT